MSSIELKSKILKQIANKSPIKENPALENKIWKVAQDRNIDNINDLIEYFESNVKDQNLFHYFYNRYELQCFARPSVTVDLIGLQYDKKADKLQVLLIKRKHAPFRNQYAFPGGFVDFEESINDAVLREVKEETNINLDSSQVIRLPAVSKPGRDPRMWVITNPNIVLFTPNNLDKQNIIAGDDALDSEWLTLNENLQVDEQLAFDHTQILQSAIEYLKKDFDHRRLPLVTKLLGKYVTTRELKNLYTLFDSKFKTQSTSNLSRNYSNYLISTKQKQKAPKDSKGGASSTVYTYKNFEA